MSESINRDRIHLLTTDVVDQIAAGEVVERPAHLVKELIENAIDAGGTKLNVEVAEGGRWVKVSDNGRGIFKQDLLIVLDRFTTSKISTAQDLWDLHTFGFRGEALASIGSVSVMTISSRTAGADRAWQIKSVFGKKSELVEVGGVPGTVVLVEDLFRNTPARLKFLKTEAGEFAVIRTTLKAIALAHPHIEIRYSENGKLFCYWSACQNILERAQQVLQLEHLWYNEIQIGGIQTRAVFVDPKTVARSSKNIWIFVQNRWVQDRGIQAAIMESYRNLLMHGEYPYAVAWIETPSDFVDVNIHPTKSQIKFQDSSLVFRATQSAFRRGLEAAPWLAGVLPERESENRITLDSMSDKPKTFFSDAVTESFKSPEMDVIRLQKKEIEIVRHLEMSSGSENSGARDSVITTSELQNSDGTSSMLPNAPSSTSSIGYWTSLEVIGQIQKTYIVCQGRNGMLLVDQHAAHERVAFEKMMGRWQGGNLDIQEFLFPLTIEMSPEKLELLRSHFNDLKRLGIYADVLGPTTIGVQAAPTLLKDRALVVGIEKMSTELYELGGSFSMEKCIGEVCASLACHSVVRAGQALSIAEMKALLESMDEYPLSSFCPHGRPVSVEYRFSHIEKEFGRLV